MYIKQVKRVCDVRGCRNVGSYHISKLREIGYSVIICEDCLRAAVAAIDGATEPKQAAETKTKMTKTRRSKDDTGRQAETAQS